MANLSVEQCAIFFLVLTQSICWTTGLFLEEKILQLEKNYMKVKEDFESKIVHLETKVTVLEVKVEQQQTLIFGLIKSIKDKQHPSTKSLSMRVDINREYKQNAIFRTCREVRASNPLLDSGMYWIDPDGQGVGDDPINVFCNMTTGSTFVPHDSELKTDVGQCVEPGCYSRKINYYASERQISALKELSHECSQSISYDCQNAPLTMEGVVVAWWNDKNDIKRNFSYWPTNCESDLHNHTHEIVHLKSQLPVKRINFGGISNESGNYSLGRLECNGKVDVKQMPGSCEDLWRIGHNLDGLYSVMGNRKLENVYCDFSKLSNEKGFQKWIGYINVKSTPVYFYVQRQSSCNATRSPIRFHRALVNIGNAMNLTSGIFTAPRSGIYFFSFTGLANFPSSSSTGVYLEADLYQNGYSVGSGRVEEANTVSQQWSPLIVQSTLIMKAGDRVWLRIVDRSSTDVTLFDDKNHYTHFTGWMVEEEDVANANAQYLASDMQSTKF